VIAKLSRPSKRSETIRFSEKAVVCKRDGQMSLMFRIGKNWKEMYLVLHFLSNHFYPFIFLADIRPHSSIINASIKAWFVSRRFTREGHEIRILSRISIYSLRIVIMRVSFFYFPQQLFIQLMIKVHLNASSAVLLVNPKEFAMN